MASQPIHLVATITVKDGKLQEVLDAFKILTADAEKNEPGLLRYFAFTTKNEEGKDQIIVVEKYAGHEAHSVHRDTEHFQAFGKKVGDLLAAPPLIKAGAYVAGFENRSNL